MFEKGDIVQSRLTGERFLVLGHVQAIGEGPLVYVLRAADHKRLELFNFEIAPADEECPVCAGAGMITTTDAPGVVQCPRCRGKGGAAARP